jgi:hypothetical protein
MAILSVGYVVGEQFECVRQDRQDDAKRLGYRFGTSGKIDDQCAMAHACDCP